MNKKDPYQRISQLIKRHPIKQIRLVQSILANILPDNLIQHINIGRLTQTRLCLLIDNPLQATQLRHYLLSIKNALHYHNRFKHIDNIQIKVQREAPSKPKKPQTRQLQYPNIEHIEQLQTTSNQIKNEKLKMALKRLSVHLIK